MASLARFGRRNGGHVPQYVQAPMKHQPRKPFGLAFFWLGRGGGGQAVSRVFSGNLARGWARAIGCFMTFNYFGPAWARALIAPARRPTHRGPGAVTAVATPCGNNAQQAGHERRRAAVHPASVSGRRGSKTQAATAAPHAGGGRSQRAEPEAGSYAPSPGRSRPGQCQFRVDSANRSAQLLPAHLRGHRIRPTAWGGWGVPDLVRPEGRQDVIDQRRGAARC